MKKIIIFLLVLFPINVFAIADHAKSSILIESSTGTIILEKNSNEKASIASMTKMMTLLIIMEYLDNGKISLSDMVPISENAASMGGSQVYLSPNSKMPLEVLLKSVSIASANDSAVALAEYVAGSKEKFVELMNERSEKLGLTNTHFMNVHGLDEENHYSTAYDMAIIAKELISHEEIFNYTSIYEDYLRKGTDRQFWLVNTNKLIKTYPGADGLKTGMTDNAGYCMAVTAKRNNMRLLAIVLGEKEGKVRNKETAELLDYGFNLYEVTTIKQKGEELGTISLDKANLEKVKIIANQDVTVLKKQSEKKKEYKSNVVLNTLKLPIYKGDVIGKLIVKDDLGNMIEEVKITVSEDLKKINTLIYLIKF